MKVGNRWNFLNPLGLQDFVRTVLSAFNGNIDNDNIKSPYVLLTETEKADSTAAQYTEYKNADGSSLRAGMPVYLSSADSVKRADGSDATKSAIGFCVSIVGSIAGVRVSGKVEDVPIETGITITAGETLWLSASVVGKVTDIRPSGATEIKQELGIAVANGSAAGGKVTISANIRKGVV